MCPVLPDLANGWIANYSDSNASEYGTVAIFNCHTGFGLVGGEKNVTCGGDGSSSVGVWSSTIPKCEGELFPLSQLG